MNSLYAIGLSYGYKTIHFNRELRNKIINVGVMVISQILEVSLFPSGTEYTYKAIMIGQVSAFLKMFAIKVLKMSCF